RKKYRAIAPTYIYSYNTVFRGNFKGIGQNVKNNFFQHTQITPYSHRAIIILYGKHDVFLQSFFLKMAGNFFYQVYNSNFRGINSYFIKLKPSEIHKFIN